MQVRDGADKFQRNAQAAGGDYLSGVQTPRRSWQAATLAAKENWVSGITEAQSKDAFAKGVQASGDAEHLKGVQTVGRQRYQQGVAVGGEAYRQGFAPHKSKLESLTLKPRGPKGTNYGRVQEVGDALRSVTK